MTDLLFGGTMLTMDKIKTGWEGESIIRRYLEKKRIHYMQADILEDINRISIIWKKGKEIKND